MKNGKEKKTAERETLHLFKRNSGGGMPAASLGNMASNLVS